VTVPHTNPQQADTKLLASYENQLLSASRLTCVAAVVLQAFTIIGGGRVGQALADMGPGNDVSEAAAAAAAARQRATH
jgi:hypothetical protein